MKKLRSFPAKLGLFLLSVISLFTVFVLTFGVVAFADLGFYIKTKDECFETLAFNYASNDIDSIYQAYDTNGSLVDFTPDKTNLIYVMRNYNGEIIQTNTTNEEILSSNKILVRRWYLKNNGYSYRFFDSIKDSDKYSEEELRSVVDISVWIDFSFPAQDRYYVVYGLLSWCYDFRYAAFVVIAVSAIIFAVSISLLMKVTARTNGTEELHFGVLYKVPLDLLIAGAVGAFWILTYFLIERFFHSTFIVAILGVLALVEINVLIGLCITVAARIKGKTFLKNNLIYIVARFVFKTFFILVPKYIAKFFKYLFQHIPFIWKGLLITLAVIAVNYFIVLTARSEYPFSNSPIMFFWFMEIIPVLGLVIYFMICMTKLKKSGEEIANGNISYKTDTNLMLGAFRKHGENLNSIANVTAQAVEEQLKSERMKTGLITNVSHDIKTPLTSIINYSELIISEQCSCEKHSEYAEVLKRKSESLKRLLSDLVEVSKASSGALDITLEPCNAEVLINQIYGEYEQRCKEAGLELVVKSTDEQITLLTDNRKIWRVFENLLNNACKYSLKGSRVYVGVERNGDNAVFSVRSTSAKPLDISPAELMERFVRGDKSRSTEGSGLGLSIAESLTAAQGGKMELAIDGDLFKVTLTFGMTHSVQP